MKSHLHDYFVDQQHEKEQPNLVFGVYQIKINHPVYNGDSYEHDDQPA